MPADIPDETLIEILSFLGSGIEIKSPDLSLCLVSRQFLRCYALFLPLAYHTVILDGIRPIESFSCFLSSPQTTQFFHPSLVRQLAFNAPTWEEEVTQGILEILNQCPGIQVLFLHHRRRDAARVLGALPSHIHPRRLHVSADMQAFGSLASGLSTSQLTHLQLYDTHRRSPSVPLEIPTLTHLVVVGIVQHDHLFSAAEVTSTVHWIMDYAPASITTLGVIFRHLTSRSSYPFYELAETVLEMRNPSVILGSSEPLTEPVDNKVTSTFFINGTQDLYWGPAAGRPPESIEWTREDMWDVIETMLENRRK